MSNNFRIYKSVIDRLKTIINGIESMQQLYIENKEYAKLCDNNIDMLYLLQNQLKKEFETESNMLYRDYLKTLETNEYSLTSEYIREGSC